jgi:monovalent cation:H+ antiporter-2, CPA2 family
MPQRVAAAAELNLLITFAIVLIAAEAGSILFRALKLPRVVGMLTAGVLIGPNINPFTESIQLNPASVNDLAFLGGIFLMFSIGLTFDARSLRRVGMQGMMLAFVAAFFSFALGYIVARGFGQPQEISLFIGLLLTPTSSTIALKLVQDQNMLATSGIETTTAGIILDDVFALFFATIVIAVVSAGGQAVTWGATMFGLVLVVALTGVFVFVAFQALPRGLDITAKLSGGNPTLFAVSLVFLVAFIFTIIGMPPIFGAFWAGAVIGSTTFGDDIRTFIQPITEIFSAVFFTAIGMLVDPRALGVFGPLALALLVVGSLAKFGGGYLSLRSFRTPTFPALMCATVLIPRGEISLVIAQYVGDPQAQAELQLLGAVLMVATALVAPGGLNLIRSVMRRRTARARAHTHPTQD